MNKAILFLAAIILLSSCSIFKKTSKKKDVTDTATIQKDVLTRMLEDIKITIPPEVWVDTYRYTPIIDTSDSTRPKPRVNKGTDPVTIEINRETQTQDSTRGETKKDVKEVVKHERKTESQGLFGFGGGFIIAIVLIAIGVIYFGIIR